MGIFLCFSLDLTLLSSWKLHWGDLYWRVCRMMTKDEAQEVHRHRALCHPQLFTQLFPPMSCPTSCVGFKSKSPNISPLCPTHSPQIPCNAHTTPCGLEDNATPEANGQMLFPGAHFCSNIGILTISQVPTHDYLSWWVVDGKRCYWCELMSDKAINRCEVHSWFTV